MSATPYIDALNASGSVRKAAEKMGIARSTFFDNLNKEKAAISAMYPATRQVKSSSKPSYYIFTCAVRGAKVHTDFWNNLQAYSKELGAELIVGPLTSLGRQRYAEYDQSEFDPLVVDYVSEDPLIIGNKIRFSPELNLTPTMVKPLQGLQTYTKRLWGIFPHTKISLETVPTHKDRPTKFIATTGAVTHPHYTPTKAGYRAHFDHVHGAVIVEVTKDGVWFRHLTPASEIDGTFYDLGLVVSGGKVSWNDDGVKALVYGDIHIEKLDPEVSKATWGIEHMKSRTNPVWDGYRLSDDATYTPLASHVNPTIQIYHDLMDMTAANYHELDNVFRRIGTDRSREGSMQWSFNTTVGFLEHASSMSPINVVVDSNHDYFVEKWLLNFDPVAKEDFENFRAYYELKIALLEEKRANGKTPLLELCMRAMGNISDSAKVLEMVNFLAPDQSFEIDGIECGWHGHRGPNGRRGTKNAFKFVTEKSVIGHLHSPSIESGTYVVGTSTKMDLGYNQGPSSWAHTHAIIYPHGGRTLVTLSDGKFWATQGDV